MRLLLILLAAAVALVMPSTASAVTTLGSSLGATAGAGPGCPGASARCTVVRTGPAGTVAAPSSGVIVTWRVKSASGGAFRLRVLRAEPGPAYSALTSSADETLAPGINVFAARLPAQAGDRIGIDGADMPAAFGGAGTTAIIGYDPPGDTFADGETHAVGATGSADLLLNVDIEPDADGDGYGDESQDACPHDSERQTACNTDVVLAVAGPEFAVAGQGAAHEYSVRTAPDGATGVVVTVPVPAGATVLAATPSSGTCTATPTVRCALGTVWAGRTATVAVTFTRSEPGVLTSSGHVEAAGSDPNASNDDATLATHFTPPSLAPPPIVLPNPPCANAIRGSRDDDVLIGTDFGDRLVGAEGSDLLRAGHGDDCLEGGSHIDVLDGGPGNDRLLGGLGRDRLLGGPGNDVLTGGHGNDYLTGSTGDDVVNPGKGRDRALGGAGNDTINARDRTRDSIDCGPGADTVRADRFDRVRGCERRVR
jgi:Ca2+-binding RTX toxin-like protein